MGLSLANQAAAGPLESFDQALGRAANGGPLFFWNYLNAGLLTLGVSAFFTALYQVVRAAIPTRAGVGLIFIPVYCAINLFCYFSQITLVPSLVGSLAQPDAAPAARLLLAELLQAWPLSSTAFFNALA